MYNDEIDAILESAYNEGYYQALADMGYELDDEAMEDSDSVNEMPQMNVSYCQNIFDILQDILPDNWQKVVFYAKYHGSSYSMKYYVDSGNGKFVDCFKLGVSAQNAAKIFNAINRQILPVRQKLDKKNTWSCMTLIVDSTGKFKTYYDYDNISDSNWKEKYLK